MNLHLDALASLLNFLGGSLLAIEALRIRQAAKERRGTEILLNAINRNNQAQPDEAMTIYDEQQTPLQTRDAIEDWFAKRSSRYAWIGFCFISAGFALDLAIKLFPSLRISGIVEDF